MRMRVLGPTTLVGLLLLIPTTVSAGVIGQSGLRGPYAITDKSTSPGGVCLHDPNNQHNLLGIEVRGPKVKARDITPGVDHQWVGFTMTVQRYENDGNWHAWVIMSYAKQYAADNAWTTFSNRRDKEDGGFRAGHYRAVITVVWFTPGSSTTIQGRLGWAVNHYSQKNGANSITVDCTDT